MVPRIGIPNVVAFGTSTTRLGPRGTLHGTAFATLTGKVSFSHCCTSVKVGHALGKDQPRDAFSARVRPTAVHGDSVPSVVVALDTATMHSIAVVRQSPSPMMMLALVVLVVGSQHIDGIGSRCEQRQDGHRRYHHQSANDLCWCCRSDHRVVLGLSCSLFVDKIKVEGIMRVLSTKYTGKVVSTKQSYYCKKQRNDDADKRKRKIQEGQKLKKKQFGIRRKGCGCSLQVHRTERLLVVVGGKVIW